MSALDIPLYINNSKMTRETHINHITAVANRNIGLIWRVSHHFPRTCAETISTSYVCPVVYYGVQYMTIVVVNWYKSWMVSKGMLHWHAHERLEKY